VEIGFWIFWKICGVNIFFGFCGKFVVCTFFCGFFGGFFWGFFGEMAENNGK